jgi:DedD protein
MQKDSVTDIELNLKKKARRRLVGAITLVLLMIVLLPILLKDRVEMADQNEVKITMDNQQESVLNSKSDITLPEDFDSKVVSIDHESAAKPIDLPDVQEQKEPNSEVEVKHVEQVKPSTQSVVKPEAKPEKPASSGSFFVQVGVFSDPVNVKQLQAKLTELGYQSKTEKINTTKGDKIRLRTKAFTSRNEAAIALENIKDAGLTGMVVSQ